MSGHESFNKEELYDVILVSTEITAFFNTFMGRFNSIHTQLNIYIYIYTFIQATIYDVSSTLKKEEKVYKLYQELVA